MELSLWKIEDDLRALVDKREELLATEFKVGPELDQALEARELIETQIKEYLRAEVRKVDGIRGYWRMCENLGAAAREEARVLTERARTWEARHEHLKATLVSVLAEFEWKDGKPKKLEGRTGSISLRGNGGLQPLNVYNPDLVPDEFCEFTVRIPGDMMACVLESFPGLAGGDRMPRPAVIREALEQPCGTCHGLPLCRDSQAIKGAQVDTVCPACAGSGKAGIPGARLEPRGQSVVVK